MWGAWQREAQLFVRHYMRLGGRCDEVAALEEPENPARTRQHRRRKTRQSPDLDSVRAVRSSRPQTMQEKDFASHVTNVDGVVADRSELIGELRELVIVRREDRLAPHGVVQVLA